MDTPVLIITFNRPDYFKKLIDALSIVKVKHLMVFKDGPRPLNNEDKIASLEIEELVKSIDWPCDVKTNYMQNNLGCGWGPFSAISWAFQYTDKLIILEDDCIPSPCFFDYCSYLLDKYKNDSRVRHISGFCQFEGNSAFNNSDYIFTQYAPTIGWATWKRVWNDMDMHERLIKKFFQNGGFTNQFATKEETKFFNDYYWARLSPLQESTHSWDYQYAVHSKMNGALSIVPSKNLIHNIGIEGTHGGGDFFDLLASTDYHIDKEPAEISLIDDYEVANFRKYHPLTFKLKVKKKILVIKNKIFGRPDFK